MSRQSLEISPLNTLASILGTCFIICVAMQLFTLAMLLLANDWAYGIHSQMFGITRETFDATAYGYLALWKILGLTFFLTPWVAIKLATRRMAA